MKPILADVFALYMKTKNFLTHEWSTFSGLSPLLDERADQLYAMTDPIAERRRPRLDDAEGGSGAG